MIKFPSHLSLDKHDIPYERHSFPAKTEKGAANVAHVLGLSERQAVKTLIFQPDNGDRVLVILGSITSRMAVRTLSPTVTSTKCGTQLTVIPSPFK